MQNMIRIIPPTPGSLADAPLEIKFPIISCGSGKPMCYAGSMRSDSVS